jgi:hypothetical protein
MIIDEENLVKKIETPPSDAGPCGVSTSAISSVSLPAKFRTFSPFLRDTQASHTLPLKFSNFQRLILT